jgi:hypothetical protein
LTSIALTDDGRVTLVMQTIRTGDQWANGAGQWSIFRSDLYGNTSTIMVEGIDLPHYSGRGWEVASNANLVIAVNGMVTYQVIDPASPVPAATWVGNQHLRPNPRPRENVQGSSTIELVMTEPMKPPK